MSDEDIDTEGALLEMLKSGDVDRKWDEATGQWKWWLTEKGLASAADLVKELTGKN